MRTNLFPAAPAFVLAPTLFLASGAQAQAVPSARADSALRAFNTAYWNAPGRYFHKVDNRTGRLDFWMAAHTWELLLEAYVRTGDPAYRRQITDMYDGFVQHFGSDWRENDFNDDIIWWVLSCTKVYEVTREARYLTQAKTHFDWVYSTQTDTVFGGGIWWKNTERLTKNSCVVLPAIIAAANLARLLNDTTYRAKAASLYAWQKATLTEPNGKVYDRIERTGPARGSTTYNQGTYIGAALALGRNADAVAGADWTRSNLCDANGVLRNTTQGDFATFNQIFVRYVLELAKVPGQSARRQWMETNAAYAWNNRRRSDNVMGYNWAAAAPSSGIESQGAAGGVILLNLLATSTVPILSPAPKSPAVPRLLATEGRLAPLLNYRGALYTQDGRRLP